MQPSKGLVSGWRMNNFVSGRTVEEYAPTYSRGSNILLRNKRQFSVFSPTISFPYIIFNPVKHPSNCAWLSLLHRVSISHVYLSRACALNSFSKRLIFTQYENLLQTLQTSSISGAEGADLWCWDDLIQYLNSNSAAQKWRSLRNENLNGQTEWKTTRTLTDIEDIKLLRDYVYLRIFRWMDADFLVEPA